MLEQRATEGDAPGRVLVMRGWPGGFCPVHCATPLRCTVACLGARFEFARAARALEGYWIRIGLRPHA